MKMAWMPSSRWREGGNRNKEGLLKERGVGGGLEGK